jgi:EAL and modified HD-GYP domain-containing signal transduction protein
MRCERDDLFTPGMHLLLRADLAADQSAAAGALAARLRALGVEVGWDPMGASPVFPAHAMRPDFVPLRGPETSDTQAWRGAVGAAGARWPGVPLVLLDLPAVEVLESLLGPGVLLAACNVATCVVPAKVQALPAQSQRLLRLLNRLLHDDDNAGVVDEIKADPALSLRLLHYLNSAGATPGRELDSIEQAVLVLGRDKLYRWIAQMLVRMSPPRPAADALQSLALARARMLELLARAEGAHNPGSLYLLGLASMLPLLLQCSLADAGEALCLSASAVAALERKDGPWGAHLGLLEALEANDIDGATSLATPFGGLDAVLALWTEAWRPR